MKPGITMFLAFFFILSLSGQESFRAGIYAGLNASQVSGDDLGGFNKMGLFGGVFVNRAFSDHWSGELGIAFSEKGSRKIAQPDAGDYSSYLLALRYIEIPLTARYGYRDFQFEFGPSIGVLMSYVEENQVGAINLDREFSKIEISMNLGAIYNISQRLGAMIRFNNSILPIRPHASGAIAPYRLNWGQYNSVVNISLRFSL